MNDLLKRLKWEILPLKQICEIDCGVLPLVHDPQTNEGNIPYIRPRDINFNTLTESEGQVSESSMLRAGVKIVPRESILIAVSGSNAGNIALLGKDAVVNHDVFYATIQNPLLHPKFLYYYLFFNRHMLIKASRYALRVSYRNLQKLDIPIPSLKEQTQIIEFLDIHLKKTNRLTDKNKKLIDQLKQKKQQLLNDVFSVDGGTYCFPESQMLSLRECGFVQAGRTPNGAIRDYYGTLYPLFKPNDLSQKMQMKSSEIYLSAKGLREARYVRADSLLICSSGVHFGKTGISRVDGACSQQMISFAPGTSLVPEFVYFQMKAERFRQQLLTYAKNLTLKKSDFQNFTLAVTDLDTQRKVVDRLYHKIDLLEKEECVLQEKMLTIDMENKHLLMRSFEKRFF